jgi:ATP-dependent Lon protease
LIAAIPQSEVRNLPNWAQALLLLQGHVADKRGLPVKKKLRILGVDDEPIIGESIACVLEAPHRKIVIAKDGQEALAMAAKQKFDVVITDHRMPRSGGMELVRKLRERDYTGKIVVISGHLSPENIGTYEDLAVDQVVGKPFDSTELRDLIADLEDEI